MKQLSKKQRIIFVSAFLLIFLGVLLSLSAYVTRINFYNEKVEELNQKIYSLEEEKNICENRPSSPTEKREEKEKVDGVDGSFLNYTSKNMGFKIDYLESLKLVEEKNSVTFVRDCSEAENSGDLIASMRCTVQGDFKISFYSGTMEQFMENFKDDCSEGVCLVRIVSQEEYFLNDIKGFNLKGVTPEGAIDPNFLFVTKNNRNYLISYNDNVEEYEKMISSFEFIK